MIALSPRVILHCLIHKIAKTSFRPLQNCMSTVTPLQTHLIYEVHCCYFCHTVASKTTIHAFHLQRSVLKITGAHKATEKEDNKHNYCSQKKREWFKYLQGRNGCERLRHNEESQGYFLLMRAFLPSLN